LDGDEVISSQLIRRLVGVVLVVSIAGCGNGIAARETPAMPSSDSLLAVPIDEQRPLFFYASDVSQIERDRLEKTVNAAIDHWGNYAPLEVWTTGYQTKPIFDLVFEYCTRRGELNQLDKFVCLDRFQNHPFEDFRRETAMAVTSGMPSMQGELTPITELGFHQITLSEPVGFRHDLPEKAGLAQEVIFHEYFHVVQDAYSFKNPELALTNDYMNMRFGETWFFEGSAEFMALREVSNLRNSGELPLYDGAINDLDFFELMRKKLDHAKLILSTHKKMSLKQSKQLGVLSVYEIGTWAVAYLVNKTNPEILLQTFYPNLEKMSWEKAFQATFGMDLSDFYLEFAKFMKLSTDQQMAILE
jgi:hypothetical protein